MTVDDGTSEAVGGGVPVGVAVGACVAVARGVPVAVACGVKVGGSPVNEKLPVAFQAVPTKICTSYSPVLRLNAVPRPVGDPDSRRGTRPGTRYPHTSVRCFRTTARSMPRLDLTADS